MQSVYCARSVVFCAALMLCSATAFLPASAQDGSAPKAAVSHSIKLTDPLDAAKTLEECLEARGTFQAEEASLTSFVEALEEALGKSVVLATKKLEEAAIHVETPMTYRLKNVRMQTALKLILGDVGLTYVLYDDDVLMITTPEDAGAQLVTRVYDCRDLLKLPSAVKKSPLMLDGKSEQKAEDIGQDDGYSVDDLIGLITMNVHPDEWDDSSTGNVADFKGMVVITQTQEIHTDIERMLNLLHKAGGLLEKVKVSR